MCESFFATLECELLDRTSFTTQAEARMAALQSGQRLLKVIIGEKIPVELIRGHEVAIECQGLSRLGDEDSAGIGVIAGQLLAFFRCLERGIASRFAFRRQGYQ